MHKTETTFTELRVSSSGMVLDYQANNQDISWMLDTSGTTSVPNTWLPIISQALESDKTIKAELQHENLIFSCLFIPVRTAGYVHIICQQVDASSQNLSSTGHAL